MSRVVAVIDRKEGIGSPRLTYDGVVADLPDGTALVTESLLAEAESRVVNLENSVAAMRRTRDEMQGNLITLQSRLDAVVRLADKYRELSDGDVSIGESLAYDEVQDEIRSAALGGESPGNDEERK